MLEAPQEAWGVVVKEGQHRAGKEDKSEAVFGATLKLWIQSKSTLARTRVSKV